MERTILYKLTSQIINMRMTQVLIHNYCALNAINVCVYTLKYVKSHCGFCTT